MPTTRRRHVITESDEVSAALRDAGEMWPEDRDRPGRLLLHLIRQGRRAIVAERHDAASERARLARERLAELHSVAGSVRFPENFLENLRQDWDA
jgi:hypothetical protein